MTTTQKTITTAALCAMTATGFTGDMLYSCPGKISNQTQGWQFLKSEAGKMVYVPFEGYYESKGGRMQSPIIKLDKQSGEAAYYSLKFKAKTSEHCYWWVDFFDTDGKPLPDTNSAVYPGKAQADYDQMLYIQSSVACIQLAFQSKGGVAVSDIAVKKVPAETAAKWNDTLYAELPALDFQPSPDSFTRLPRTAAALKSGKAWKVVMLGDSIMNDSYNSVFQALIKRDFPKSNFDFIISVRGSTGCWYYQEPEHFKSYVTDLKPDLLIIGGISNKNDIDAIRKVIEMTRKQIGCEILLMSGPLDKDWRKHDEQTGAVIQTQIWTPNPFVEKQRQLAAELKVEFLDVATAWHNYLGQSGKPWQWFHRDAVHGNDRGKQIVGRILQKYFLTANDVK